MGHREAGLREGEQSSSAKSRPRRVRDDAGSTTGRFAERRAAIIAAGCDVINHRGVRAMTLKEVGSKVGLYRNSITYYFKRKEDLAVACFLDGISRLDAVLDTALKAPSPGKRLHAFLEGCFALDRQIRQGVVPPVPILGDIRALAPDNLKIVRRAYRSFFLRARGIFDAPGTAALSPEEKSARTHILLEQVYWLPAWLPEYDIDDYPRLCDRMFDILANGISAQPVKWPPSPCALGRPGEEEHALEGFLRSSTRLINERGYRGVSVDALSAEINLTKGAFYHHHDAKSDLVIACFRRSFAIVKRAQLAALSLDEPRAGQLAAAAAALVAFQVSEEGPLLRSSAYIAIPEEARIEMMRAGTSVTNRFASMIVDGAIDGSIRAVDPMIAAQVLSVCINIASDIRIYAPSVSGAAAPGYYARPFFDGLCSP